MVEEETRGLVFQRSSDRILIVENIFHEPFNWMKARITYVGDSNLTLLHEMKSTKKTSWLNSLFDDLK